MGKIQIANGVTQIAGGQKFSLPVTIHFDKPTKVRGIHAKFYGAERTEAQYTETQTDSDGDSKTVTRTATEHVDITKEAFVLLGEQRKGFFSRIGDSMATMVGGGSHEMVDAGSHEFNVEVELPAGAPPSFKGKKCEVFYRLEVRVDVPIKIDWYQAKQFEICPPPIDFNDTEAVHVTFPDSSGRSFWDKTFGKDVALNFAIDQNKFNGGEAAHGMLTVDSPEPVRVNDIVMTLVGQEKVYASGHRDRYDHRIKIGSVDCPNLISSGAVFEFEIDIPNVAGPFTQVGTKFSVDWHIELQVKIPWAKDPLVRLPIELHPDPVDAKTKDNWD